MSAMEIEIEKATKDDMGGQRWDVHRVGTREGNSGALPRQVQFPQLGPTPGGPVWKRAGHFVAVQVQLAETRGLDRVHIYFARLEAAYYGNYNVVYISVVVKIVKQLR